MAIYTDVSSTSQITYPCRAWIRLHQNNGGNQTIYASGGISSISDNGLGHTQVNFTTNMPNGNYAIVGGAQQSGTYGSGNNYCFSLCIQNYDQTNLKFLYRPSASSDVKEDNSQISIAVFI
tara:strand:+ start:31 stop:393 length:363 start_codon:yes stop_codon:yes gene_type:complete